MFGQDSEGELLRSCGQLFFGAHSFFVKLLQYSLRLLRSRWLENDVDSDNCAVL
jgi:hypothetical protein